jgi:hypothetical protein
MLQRRRRHDHPNTARHCRLASPLARAWLAMMLGRAIGLFAGQAAADAEQQVVAGSDG